MAINVVHCKKVANHEYIGRPSPLGNPFVWDKSTPKGSTIPKYKIWLEEKIKNKDPKVMEELWRLLRIAQNGDLNLGCWCAPGPCHGDVIKEVLERALLKLTKGEN